MKQRTAKKRISHKLNQDDFSHGFKVFFYKYATVDGYLLDICTARPKRQGASKTTMNEQMFHREHVAAFRMRTGNERRTIETKEDGKA